MVEWDDLLSDGWTLEHLTEKDERFSLPMQFTGLYDKNGTEVYKKDICKDILTGELYVVQYSVESGQWFLHRIKNGAVMNNVRLFNWQIVNGLEVIGNIYENRELLKEESK